MYCKVMQIGKEWGIGCEVAVNAVDIAANKHPYVESLYRQVKDLLKILYHIKQLLINDI